MFLKLLKKNHIKQQILASQLNVSQQAVSNWCRGLCEPSISLIIKISETFKIPIEEIVLSFKKEAS